MSEQTKKTPELEELFEHLDTILKRMQEDQVTLDESFQLYEQGMKDIRTCTDILDGIEKKMLVLSGDGSMEPLDAEDEPEPSVGQDEK
jgi:exodeoxyribonuclease VII small subunit